MVGKCWWKGCSLVEWYKFFEKRNKRIFVFHHEQKAVLYFSDFVNFLMGDLPRMPLAALGGNPAAFLRAMTETGFVVLTEIGEGEKLHRDMMADFAAFMACSKDEKQQATSRKVYKAQILKSTLYVRY